MNTAMQSYILHRRLERKFRRKLAKRREFNQSKVVESYRPVPKPHNYRQIDEEIFMRFLE